MRDKRETITGLLPFNENEQHFEIQHTEGPTASVPSPPALAKSNTAWVFCHKGWSAFPALPRLRQGDQRAPNPGWAARCLLGSYPLTLLSITQNYVQPIPEQNAGTSCSV